MELRSRSLWLALTTLLGLTASAAAQVPQDEGSSVGAWWGGLFWIGITLVLLFCAALIAYNVAKRPNKS